MVVRAGFGQHGSVKAERYIQRIDPYLDRLLTAFDAASNYTGSEIQPERRLLLYGVGQPTPEVAAIIAEAPAMLEVVWHPARYTCAELCAEADRIMERFPQISMGGPRNDGSGLDFTTEDPALVNADDVPAALGSRYPVTIEEGPPPVPC